MPCKLLQCWQTKATLQGEHMMLRYRPLQCTFVTVVALAENT